VVDLNIEHVHVGNIDDIGPGASARTKNFASGPAARCPGSVVMGAARGSVQRTEEAYACSWGLSMVRLDSARHRCH
jgi:hypothetical protein